MPRLNIATFDQLDPLTLYLLLRLRVDVFVVEQDCPYPELDGRDTEPGTRHVWLADDATSEPLAYLRILRDPHADRIGRVCVAGHARGEGHAARLLDAALREIGDRDCVLDAQAYLVGLYERYGFRKAGPPFDDDGILHVPMVRAGSRSDRGPAGAVR